MRSLQIKRAYDPPSATDGQRILVDRLWPRGLSKEKAHLDHWTKEVAPSAALRHWFGHDPDRWDEFRSRYRDELRANDAAIAALRALIGGKPATLLYAAHNTQHNNAVVLRDFLAGE